MVVKFLEFSFVFEIYWIFSGLTCVCPFVVRSLISIRQCVLSQAWWKVLSIFGKKLASASFPGIDLESELKFITTSFVPVLTKGQLEPKWNRKDLWKVWGLSVCFGGQASFSW